MLGINLCTSVMDGVNVCSCSELSALRRNERIISPYRLFYSCFSFSNIALISTPLRRSSLIYIREKMTIFNDREKIVFTVLEKENLKENTTD